MPDDLTSTLDQYRERPRYAVTYDDWHQVGRDARHLLKAIEAVLKLADGPVGLEGRGLPGDGLAVRRAVREAITRELTKGEGGDGRS